MISRNRALFWLIGNVTYVPCGSSTITVCKKKFTSNLFSTIFKKPITSCKTGVVWNLASQP
jgi:hypothetical protein